MSSPAGLLKLEAKRFISIGKSGNIDYEITGSDEMKKAVTMTQVGIPVLITSAINVSASHTVLIDVEDRLRLTLQSIEHWRSMPMVSYVVVCDGSGFDLRPYICTTGSDLSECDCEVISFTNNKEKVRSKGKGYGEGEIVNYALRHSQVLQGVRVFAKCTGKLWVENFSECLKNFNQVAAFDFCGNIKPKYIDTRFYIVDKEFYMTDLAELHHKVDDDNGFYLEHAFRDGLKKLKLSDYAMYPTPRVNGVSGSMGTTYKRRRVKSIIRDIRLLVLIKLGKLFNV